MNRLWRLLILGTFMLLALFGGGNAVHASATNLPPGFLVGDDTGFQSGKDGAYFIVNKDIVPGGSFSREITLQNYSAKGYKGEKRFVMNLVMNPEDEEYTPEVSGEVNLLEAVSVTLTYEGEIIYKGPINGAGTPIANQRQNPISLGVFNPFDSRVIYADFEVSDEYPEEAWQNVNSADFYWLFFASRENLPPPSSSSSDSTTNPSLSSSDGTLPSTGGKLPQTGEDWRNVLLGMIAGLVLVTVALISAKRRHENQRD